MKRFAIHSVPRSGSTWLGSIFDSSLNVAYRYQPLFSYSHKSQLNEKSSKEKIEKFFTDILYTTDDFVLQTEAIKKKIVPKFQKGRITHIGYKEVRYHHILRNLLEKDEEIIVIGLIRNPLSVINSWLKAPKEFKIELGWEIEEEWRYANKKNQNKPEEFNGFEKWKEVVLLFEKLKSNYGDRFFILGYSDLLRNTENVITDLFNKLNVELGDQTKFFLKQCKAENNTNPYSVFKKKQKDDSWKEFLPNSIIAKVFDDLKKNNLEDFLEYPY